MLTADTILVKAEKPDIMVSLYLSVVGKHTILIKFLEIKALVRSSIHLCSLGQGPQGPQGWLI